MSKTVIIDKEFDMFATLIIKNIGNLYTCDDKFTIYRHAFIALYHDKIIDIGQHDYHKWIEDGTYVIDAASRAVIPGLIEPRFELPPGRSKWDVYRKAEECYYYHQMNGTLTICMTKHYKNPNPLLQDLIQVDAFQPVLENLEDCKNTKNYLISCKPGVVSLHSMGNLLFYGQNEPEWQILKGMTCNPAKALGLSDRGSLEIGKLADILVLNEPDLKRYYQAMGRPLYARIIKKGIPVYPAIRRV